MKNKNKNQYRQGDVLIERVASLPKKLKSAARENGRVVLAHGEVTGHAHFFAEAAVEKLVSPEGEEFFRIGGQQIAGRFPIVRRWREQVMVRHPKLGLLHFAEADVAIEGDHAVVGGEFGLLHHGLLKGDVGEQSDHNTHAIPAGLYRGGSAGGDVGQSEYDPEEIRRVID